MMHKTFNQLSATRFAPWIILGWSLLVHLPGITSPFLDYHAHRQCQTASMARNYAERGMHFFTPEVDTFGYPRRTGTEFPIYSYVLGFLFLVFGTSEIWGRLLSSLFGAGSAVLLFLYLKRRISSDVAWIAAMVLCVLPVHLYFTRSVQPEPLALCAVLGYMFFLERWMSSRSWLDVIAVISFGALGPLLKLNYMFFIGPYALFVIFEHRTSWRMVVHVAVMFGASIALAAGWYHYARSAPNQVLPVSADFFFDNLKPVFSWRLWKSQLVSRCPEIVFTYAGVVFSFFAFRVSKTQSRFLLSWLLISLFYVAMNGEYGLIHKYTLLPVTPVAAALIGCGLVGCMKIMFFQNRTWILLLLLMALPIHSVLRIRHWYRIERTYLYEAKVVLDSISKPDAMVLTNTAELPVLHYYLHRYGYVVDSLVDSPIRLSEYKALGVQYFLTPTEGRWMRSPQWHDTIRHTATLIHQTEEYELYKL